LSPETLLLRQVHPSFVQNGRPTSQVFRPTPKDDDKLSVYDGDKISPEASWTHYTNVLAFKSVGVLAVSLNEVLGEAVLPVIADNVPFPEHCSVDFTGLAKTDVDKKAKQLASYAVSRGWLFQRTA
jgi:hypothetical protein